MDGKNKKADFEIQLKRVYLSVVEIISYKHLCDEQF